MKVAFFAADSFHIFFFLFIFLITWIEDTMKHSNNLILCPNRSQHWTASSWWMQWLPGDPSTAAGIWNSQMTWPVIRWLEYIKIYAATQFPNEPPVSGTTCRFQSEADLWAIYFSKNESVHIVKEMLLQFYYIKKKKKKIDLYAMYSILFSQGRNSIWQKVFNVLRDNVLIC